MWRTESFQQKRLPRRSVELIRFNSGKLRFPDTQTRSSDEKRRITMKNYLNQSKDPMNNSPTCVWSLKKSSQYLSGIIEILGTLSLRLQIARISQRGQIFRPRRPAAMKGLPKCITNYSIPVLVLSIMSSRLREMIQRSVKEFICPQTSIQD